MTICSLASPATASEMRSFAASYVAENDYITGGIAYLTLTPGKEHNGYDLILQTKPTGLLKWNKKGHVRQHAVLATIDPFTSISYRYTNRGDKKRNYTATFLREDNQASVDYAGKVTTVPLKSRITDRLSMMLAIMLKLGDSPDFAAVEFDVLDGLRIRKMTFDNLGPENLRTSLGNLDTVRIHRRRENSNRETVSWFATLPNSNNVIPVKIEQFKNGKLSLRLKITDFKLIE